MRYVSHFGATILNTNKVILEMIFLSNRKMQSREAISRCTRIARELPIRKARGSPGAVFDDDQVLRSGRWCTIKVLFGGLVA